MARRRYGLWDQIALATMLRAEHRSPRFVPRLGAGIARTDRLRRWLWRRSVARWRVLLWGLLLVALMAGVFLGRVEYATHPAFKYVLLAVYTFLLAWTGWFVVLSFAEDVRWVVIRRSRVAILRDVPAAKAASEVVNRRNTWQADLEAQRHPMRRVLTRRSPWTLLQIALPLALLVVQVANAFASSSTNPAAPPQRMTGWMMLFFAFVMVTAIATNAVYKAASARLSKSLKEQTCPECAYPQPDGMIVHDEQERAVHLGPAFCSECGTPWPLVPPESVGFVTLEPKNLA